MTYVELVESVPNVYNLVFRYFTSAYFVVSILVMLFVFYTTYNGLGFNVQTYFKELRVALLIWFLIINTGMFLFNNYDIKESWKKEELQAYLGEQDTFIKGDIQLKTVTIYKNDLDNGHIAVLKDNNLEELDVSIKYEDYLNEPKLTYVKVEKDIKFGKNNLIYKKGDLVPQTLILPTNYYDVRVPIEYIDTQRKGLGFK